MGDAGSTIRWDLGRMAEMSTLLERRSTRLHSARIRCLDVYEGRTEAPPPLRTIVLAAEWAGWAAAALRRRRKALLAAETGLIWQLSEPTRTPRFQAKLQARSITEIVADLESACDPSRSPAVAGSASGSPPPHHRVLRLLHELAIATHHRLVMSPDPPSPELLAELAELVNYLGYQAVRSRPAGGAIGWHRVFAALDQIRASLDESWFEDVGRGDLQTITAELGALSGPELDAAIGLLTGDELYRWFHELDGVRGGNLDAAEEAELFGLIARRAAPATLLRLALTERGSRFGDIAAAIRDAAPLEVKIEFVELCAAGATDSEQLLVGAVAGLAALDGTSRRIALTSLQTAGLLEPLARATTAFIENSLAERSEPLIVEFFSGLLLAVRDGAAAVADLTVVGLIDRHRFRQAWSSLAGVASLAITDPAEFAAAVIDIEMMRRNPARWLGATTADLATAGLGKLARLGRLGRAARAIADLMTRLGEARLLRAGKVQLEAGHIHDVIGRLDAAADALELGALLEQVEAIEATTAELEAAVDELESLSLQPALDLLNQVITRVTDQVAALRVIAGPEGALPQMIESSVPAT